MQTIPREMWRLEKPEGFGNMTVARAEVPEP